MSRLNKITFILSLVFWFLIASCANSPSADEVGENIGEVAEDVGNEIEDACEATKEQLEANDTDC